MDANSPGSFVFLPPPLSLFLEDSTRTRTRRSANFTLWGEYLAMAEMIVTDVGRNVIAFFFVTFLNAGLVPDLNSGGPGEGCIPSHVGI